MIYIVLPVFNRKKFTQNFLESLRKQTSNEFRTIVVDDGSTDGTQKMISQQYPEVILLETTGDLYWTATVNLGIKYALSKAADYVLTLNNDTIVFEDFIEKTLFWIKKYPNALQGAFALDAKTKLPVYGGENINWKKCTSTSWLDVLNEKDYQGLHEVTHFPGRGLLIPKSCFEKIGYFDEKTFPHYAADYDFTHKAIRNGFKVYCNHDARIYIYPEESGDRENRKRKTLFNYYQHLFGRKGGGNLRNFILYVLRNCPTNYIPSYLFIGCSRRIIGYWIK